MYNKWVDEKSFLKNYVWHQSVSNFFGAYFHQDIDSTESALEEFFQETDKNFRLKLITDHNAFLDSDLNEQIKAEYIAQHTDLYFPVNGLKPIEWLRNVVTYINKLFQI